MNSKKIAPFLSALLVPLIFGCKTHSSTGVAAPGALYVPGAGYQRASVANYAPPTIHYWASSGTAAINASLMNHIR